MKIALVHDYLAQDGGAERVLLSLHRMWPEAPIFTLFHQKGSVSGFDDADIRESYIARLPWGRKEYQWYLPLMPQAFESFDFTGFDVVISSTSASSPRWTTCFFNSANDARLCKLMQTSPDFLPLFSL